MKKLVFALVGLLLVGAVAFWYFHRDNDKARDAVPEDAAAVAVLEPAKLVKDLGLDLKDVLKLASVAGDVEGTVDLTKPLYAFTTEKGVSGISINVSDADKLLKLITGFGFASEEQDGKQWVANDKSIGLIDKDKMVLMDASTPIEQDAMREEISLLMSQSRKDVKALENLDKQDGLLRLSFPLNLVESLSSSISQPSDLGDLEGAVLNTAFQVEKKALKLSANLQTPTKLNIPLAPIKGDLANIGPSEPFLWLCVNMNGEELLPYLRKAPQLRSALLALNMSVDADMMLKAIKGDVSLAVPKLDLQHPDFILTASLSDTDFLKNADDWKGVTKRGAADFIMNDARIFFGVRDNKLYIASSEGMATNAFVEAPNDAFQSAAKGKYLSASLNANEILKAYPGVAILLRTVPQIRDITDAVERVSLTADSPQSIELSLETSKPVKELISNLWTLLSGDQK